MIQDGEFVFENASGEPVGMSLRYAHFGIDGERLASDEVRRNWPVTAARRIVAFSGGRRARGVPRPYHHRSTRHRAEPTDRRWVAAAAGTGARQLDTRGLPDQRPGDRRPR